MIWLESHLAILVLLIIGFLLAVVVTQQRRSPQSSLAWLLGFMLLPYLAIPLFLFLGFRKKRHDTPQIDFGDRVTTVSGQGPVFDPIGLPPSSPGHCFTLIHTPQQAYDLVVRTIATSQRDLCVMFYLIGNDDVGEAFVDSLTEKVREGVNVRLLLDWFGGVGAPRRALARFVRAGGALRYAARPRLARHGIRLNQRNHRKMIICDGRDVFAGGMNIGNAYMTPTPNGDTWQDLSYQITGPAVATLMAVFRSDWSSAGTAGDNVPSADPQTCAGPTEVQIVPSGPDLEGDHFHDGLVRAIYRAESKVLIATPYFLPSDALFEAVIAASKRKVEVTILIPNKSNQRIADIARGPYLRDIQNVGGNVMLHPCMVHAKAGVIDDVAWVGSANFDMRSMLLNYEVALFVSDKASVGQITKWFETEIANSKILAQTSTRAQRIVEGFFRLMAPVL